MLLLAATAAASSLLFAVGVVCIPVLDSGPHLTYGWGQVVRQRHLYAAGPGLHLLICGDGQIHGSVEQSPHSLMEIRSVGPGGVVIRGMETARFLCIEGDGGVYSSLTYSREDCTFREQILLDGYSVYASDSHGALLSMGNRRQMLQGLGQGVPALARFLPRIGTLDLDRQACPPGPDDPNRPTGGVAQTEEEPVDVMDSFGKLSQILHSPSFHKR